MITKEEIFAFLERCGVRHNDVVTIHCSLRSIGPIENGADGLIDALCQWLYDGLLLVPTHTWRIVGPTEPFYDVKTTPPGIGVLAKVAAFRPDGKRSLHPTHSVMAFGKRAAEYIKGEELSDCPAPATGCLSRLYEENGKILLIGVGQERNSYLHAVDMRLNIPNRLREETFTVTIRDEDGREYQSPPFHPLYTPGVKTCCSDYYPNYQEAFDYFGAVTYTTLGNAKAACCDARRITDIIRLLWEKADYDLCVSLKRIPPEYYQNESLENA